MFKRSVIIIVLFSISIVSAAFAAESDWSVHINVSVPDTRGADGTVWNHLVAGVRDGATDGFDSSRDTVSLVEADDPVQALFPHGIIPEDTNSDGVIDKWACRSPEEGYSNYKCSLWRDIRTSGTEKVWLFMVLSTVNGGTITLNWSFEESPEDLELMLVDRSNPEAGMNMLREDNQQQRYAYTNIFEPGKKYGIRYFEIRMKATGEYQSSSIPQIDAESLPDGQVAEPYSGQISVSGGRLPLTWDIMGNIPEGLAIDTTTGILSGTPIVSGIYDFMVTIHDTDGAADSKRFRVAVKDPGDQGLPEGINSLKGMYINDTSILLIWTAPTDDSMTNTSALYDLRYLEGCTTTSGLDDTAWDVAIEVNGEPRPQAGALQTYTLAGLDPVKTYCIAIKSVDSSGHISPVSNTITFPLSSDTYAGTSGPVEWISSITLRKGYNLVSIPLMPVPNERESLFAPSVGSPVALYRWYSAYPGITPPQYYLEDTVLPGLGYFLYSPVDGINLLIDGIRVERPEYGMVLQAGWNLIGTPYDNKILMKDTFVRDSATGGEKSFIDAVKSGMIGNTLYYMNEGNYDFISFNDDPPAAFVPWTGYWIYVNDGDGLEIVFRRPD